MTPVSRRLKNENNFIPISHSFEGERGLIFEVYYFKINAFMCSLINGVNDNLNHTLQDITSENDRHPSNLYHTEFRA